MIRFDNVTKEYPDGTAAVEGLNLEAPTGKLTILVGPSGCGKTTSLRMVNRLIEPTGGTIFLNDEPTSGMDAALLRRRIGYVIQHAGLFPHRTIVDNISTMPVLLGENPRSAKTKALELMERVGLDLKFAKRYPWQLSGGQQQRVGVARALASDPAFMLMDEPFSAVDPVVRTQLQDEFLRLQREIGKTIIMVTHDIDEALKLGDQVAVMRVGGQVAQMASPAELLTAPADDFVADFVGRDRGYRSLGFAASDGAVALADEPTVQLGADRSAVLEAANGRWILAVDAQNRPLGWAQVSHVDGPLALKDLNLSGTSAKHDGTMRELLDSALSSPSRRGVVVGADGALIGTVTSMDVIQAIESRPHLEEAR